MEIPKDLGKIEFLREHPQILERLVEVSKAKSLEPFIKDKYAGSFYDEGGFIWEKSEEGDRFWRNILEHEDPNHFYTVYPKKENKLVFEENTVYHAETEEEANLLLQEANKQRFRWKDNNLFIEDNKYFFYKENTCYFIIAGECCSKDYYDILNYKIVKVKDFLSLEKKENTITSKDYIKNLKEEIVIHCETQEEWIEILTLLQTNKYTFGIELIYFKDFEKWNEYREKSCIRILPKLKDYEYGKRDYYYNQGYNIIKASQILNIKTNDNEERNTNTQDINSSRAGMSGWRNSKETPTREELRRREGGFEKSYRRQGVPIAEAGGRRR